MSGLQDLIQSPVGVSRSITAENFNGEPGAGGKALDGTGAHCAKDLGQGWKISPSILLKEHDTFTLANIEGPGIIRHIWITVLGDQLRKFIIRFYWDNQEYSNAYAGLPVIERPDGILVSDAAFKTAAATSFRTGSGDKLDPHTRPTVKIFKIYRLTA